MPTKKIALILLLVLAPVGIFSLFSCYYAIGINMTDSLPDTIYLITKGKLPKSRGEYISFIAPNNKLYEQPFVKLVGGVEGDMVTEESHKFYINGKFIGCAKKHSKTGEEVELGFTGSIPQGCYFVYSKHKDSYDSKYKNIGLVCGADVIGTVHPIL